MSTEKMLAEIGAERARQDERWGEQNHPDGTGGDTEQLEAIHARGACQLVANDGTLTWRHILREEVAEAFAESDEGKLRAELIQVAAVAAAWAEAIDRRNGGHIAVVCKGEHDRPGCQFCDGGLFACSVCGSAEGATTTHCPGGRMAADQIDAVYAGTLDYRDGAWREGECSKHTPAWWQTEAGQAVITEFTRDRVKELGL